MDDWMRQGSEGRQRTPGPGRDLSGASSTTLWRTAGLLLPPLPSVEKNWSFQSPPTGRGGVEEEGEGAGRRRKRKKDKERGKSQGRGKKRRRNPRRGRNKSRECEEEEGEEGKRQRRQQAKISETMTWETDNCGSKWRYDITFP